MSGMLGIVAGGGALPGQLMERCRETGRPFCVAALKGHALPDVCSVSDVPCLSVRMGEAGKAVRFFKEHGVQEVVMIGPVRRPSLLDLRPDWWTAKFLMKIGFKAFGDDNLLSAVIRHVEAEGFKIVGIHELLPDIIATEGVFGKVSPDEQAEADIEHGIKIARGLGALDVGQSVVVQQGIVLGVEAVEGTDALIKRCKDLKREGPGGVLVKTKKPRQEQRADLPTVGMTTLLNAHEAGLRGIAVQAGKTLIVDRAALTAKADELGMFIVAVKI